MKIVEQVPEYIRSLIPYEPGKPIEEVEREYGISGSVKLASNENPLGPSPKALAAALDHMAGFDGPALALYGPLPSGLRVLRLNRRWAGQTFDATKSAAWNGRFGSRG